MIKIVAKKLSDIAEITMGQSPRSEYYNSNEEGMPFLQGNRTFGDKYPNFDTYTTNPTKIAIVNDVIMSVRAPVGDLNITPKKICLGRGVCSIHMKNGNQDFLYYLMKYYVKDILNRECGTVFGSVNKNDISSLIVKIPERFEEQKKISSILSVLDDKIELNKKINRNLEAQAQAIFKSWFIDFEPFKNGKFIDSELGRIPEGWVCKKLKDFVEIKRGSSPRPIQDYLSGSGYNWLKISDATSESSPFIFNIKEHIKKSGISQTVYLVAGELVLSNSATPGIPKFLDVNTCIHDGWLWFSNSKLSYEFLYLFFFYKRRDFISLGNGSVFTNLKTDIVKDALFVYPNKAVMDEFDKITKTIFENIKIRSRESQRLTQLRDALLPKLMSGELTISDYIG